MKTTVTTTVEIPDCYKSEIIDAIKKLDGLPPYDGFNVCQGDGWYAKSIEEKYGHSITVLKELVGYKDVVAKWEQLRQQFLRR